MFNRLAAPNDNGDDPHVQVGEISMATESKTRPTSKKSYLESKPAVNSSQQQGLKNYVFTDPLAFRYLEQDPACTVYTRSGIIEGYKLYLVEQWACSRTHPTFVVTAYTGDSDHKAIVGVLGIPQDEDLWTPKIHLYFNALSEFYARLQETPLGLLMVTNLNYFPSNFTIIPVPDGNVNKHWNRFLVNENLKRLGCSGRSGISLAAPPGATQAKFLQLYKTSQRVSLSDAVIELVKLCQVALILFDKLKPEYADGCLCDVTQVAITEWWTEIGSEHYNSEPSDGILGPTTVAGLLGMLIGARNRLSSCGAPVGKDAFDLYHFKRGIEHFQKSQKLKRTRRLDRHTLDRLHKITAKAAASENWTVPKAVKSTVAELSGKGGEIVLGIVGRDKAGIGDIETLNIDDFISLAHGERTKWLWHGKVRRGVINELQSLPSSQDDSVTLMWPHGRSENRLSEDGSEDRWREEKSPSANYARQLPGQANGFPESPSDRDYLHRTVFKSVSGRMNDARNGLGRIKDAVGLRGYAYRQSKDDNATLGNNFTISSIVSPTSGSPLNPRPGINTFISQESPTKYLNETRKPKESTSRPVSQIEEHNSEFSHSEPPITGQNYQPQELSLNENHIMWTSKNKKNNSDISLINASVTEISEESEPFRYNLVSGLVFNSDHPLFRRNSISGEVKMLKKQRNENWWPRRMSFSEAENALYYCESCPNKYKDEEGQKVVLHLHDANIAEVLKRLYDLLAELQKNIKPWVENELSCVKSIDKQLSLDQENFQGIYAHCMEQYRMTKYRSQELVDLERTHIIEEIKEIEILGAKLEYEINALDSKVNDVEECVSQLRRQVDDLEFQANKLETQLKTESWTRWIVRSVVGVVAGTDVLTSSEI